MDMISHLAKTANDAHLHSSCEKLWREAHDQLRDKDKTILGAPGPVDVRLTLDLAKRKIQEAKASRLVFKLPSGKTLVVRDVFDKVAHWLNKIVETGDVIVQYDPGHAALPWAAVRIILQTSLNAFEARAAVTEAFEVAARMLVWGSIQAHLYLNESEAGKDELRRGFAALFEGILVILAKILRYLAKNKRRVVASSFISHADKLRALIATIQARQKTVQEFSAQVSRSDQIRQSYDVNSLRATLQDLVQPVVRLQDFSTRAFDLLQASAQREVLNWTSTIEYEKHFSFASQDVFEGTGLWLFDDPQFCAWQECSTSEIVWLHGIPGSGKSKLSTILLQHLKNNNTGQGIPMMAFFYCSRSAEEPGRSDPAKVMTCLLRQLSSLSDGTYVSSALKTRYEKRFVEGEIKLNEAIPMILDTIENRSITYLVIDALDECDPDKRHELIDAFDTILQDSRGLVKIFVSSRREGDIIEAMSQSYKIELGATNNNHDIELFVSHQVDRLVKQKRLLRNAKEISDKLITEIKNRLCEGAEGMFLWVSLQLQYLCRLKLPGLVRQRLGKLPVLLQGIYDEIYDSGISEVPEEEAEATRLVLSLMLVAQQKLSGNEFLALASAWDTYAEQMSQAVVLSLCFNLVVFDEATDSFRFSHPSVREFLETRQEFNSQSLHERTAEVCLRSLLLKQKASPHNQLYAKWYWAYHVSMAFHKTSEQTRLIGLVERFLLSDDRRRTTSVSDNMAITDFTPAWTDSEFCIRDVVERGNGPLLNASAWGLEEIVYKVHARYNTVPNLRGWKQELADSLEVAIHYNRYEIARFLITAGAPLGISLPIAAAVGSFEIVHLAASHGADLYARYNNRTALEFAAAYGDERVVAVLVEEFSVDLRRAEKSPAIVLAAQHGRLKIVKLLLKFGATVDARNVYNGTTALHEASSNSPDLVDTLLYNGANVHAKDDMGHTALHYACSSCNLETVASLLKHGADVEALSYRGETPLWRAIRTGNIDTIKFMIDRDCNVNTRNSQGDSILLLAIELGSESIVRLLTQAGAKLTALRVTGETALSTAAAYDELDIVKLLIEMGADPNEPAGRHGSAFEAAISWGCTDVVRFFLDYSFEMVMVDSLGMSALELAACCGQIDIVELLIARGAPIDQADPDKGSALAMASTNGFLDVVQILINNQANVNRGRGRALRAAIKQGHQEVVELLIESGADVNLFSLGERSMLDEALSIKNVSISGVLEAAGADKNYVKPASSFDEIPKKECSLDYSTETLYLEQVGGSNSGSNGNDGYASRVRD